MNLFRHRPWIFLVVLFILPVLAWSAFIFLARKNPALPLPPDPPAPALAQPPTGDSHEPR